MYEPSPKVQELQARLSVFMDKHIYPNEARHFQEAESLGPWKVHPVVEELKPLARKEGLWNLFLPHSEHGAGLTNLEYAPLVRNHGPLASWRPRSSTVRRPTPATWKCWRATARPSTRSAG
jgi:alkylation response protein AidB-like acyl-CoA dehydrogenase